MKKKDKQILPNLEDENKSEIVFLPMLMSIGGIVVGTLAAIPIAILTILTFAYLGYFIVRIRFVSVFIHMLAFYSNWDTLEKDGWFLGFTIGIVVGVFLLVLIIWALTDAVQRITNSNHSWSPLISCVISVCLSLPILWWWIIIVESPMESSGVRLFFRLGWYLSWTILISFGAITLISESEEESVSHKSPQES